MNVKYVFICAISLFLSCMCSSNAKNQIKLETAIDLLCKNVKCMQFPFGIKCFAEFWEQNINKTISVDTTVLICLFRFSEKEIFFETFDYNQDEDIKTNIRKENVVVDILGYYRYNDKRVVLINSYGEEIPQDGMPIHKCNLFVFSESDEVIDSMTVFHRLDCFSINKQFVILSENKFRVFDYVFRTDVYENKINRFGVEYSELKEPDSPLTEVVIYDYEISKSGIISKTNTEKKYLRNGNNEYGDCSYIEDDPMNKYRIPY